MVGSDTSRFCSVVAALVTALLLIFPSSALPYVKDKPVVLVLDSYNIGYDWSDEELQGVQTVLEQSALKPAVLVEYLDAKRFPGKGHFNREADLLAAKFRNTLQPDVVLAMDNAALEFAIKYRPSVFPDASIVFCGVNDFNPGMIAGQKRITGVAELHDSVGTLELALRLFPKTREVLLIHDYTDTGLAMRNELSQVAGRFPGVNIAPARDMRLEKLVQQVGRLREGQIALLLSYTVEVSGRVYPLSEVAGILSKASPVPVFAVHATQLGQGVLGGIMLDGRAQGEAAARLTEKVLRGADAGTLPVITSSMSVPMFDYRLLERYGLLRADRALPPGSIVINRPKAFYQINKTLAWSGMLLIATLVLALAAVVINGRRQLAIRALEEANHAYRHLLDSVPDSVYIFAADGSILETNSAAATNTGYSRAELCSRKVADLVVPEFAHLAPPRIEAILEQGRLLFESEHYTRDGRRLPLEVSAQVAEFHGRPCIISINRDITLRKHNERELHIQAMTLEQEVAERQQVSEDLRLERDNVRALFDAAPVGMLLIDETISVIDSNSTMNRLIRQPVEEILGLRPGSALSCQNASAGELCGTSEDCSACHIREGVSVALARGVSTQGLEIQHTVRQADRTQVVWLRFSVVPVHFSGKRHALVAIDDVSQQREMELQVLAEKERLAVTLASLGEGVITTDTAGNITLMNQAAQSLTGWDGQEALGKPLAQVFRLLRKSNGQPVPDLHLVGEDAATLEAGGHVLLLGMHGRALHLTGTRAPMRDHQRRSIGQVLVFRDTTEKHELENELFQARKLDSLGVLAGGLAHDLNNLLTAIIGNISIAELKARGNDELQPFLARALKASERTGDLTHQLLTFAKGGAPVKKITSLENIVKESAEFALRGSNIRLCYQIAEQIQPVAVDLGQMSQVVNNLVINAKQAMPEGGILQIAMENLEGPCLPGGSPQGRCVRVSVQDQGGGIPAENLERIFDPYFTTKKSGSGLGLASVHAIIAKHDGTLKVESRVGEGTTFSFVIPASDRAPVNPEPGGQPLFRDQGRVLVMDDDTTIIETLCDMLQLIGYEVVTCADGYRALQRYREGVRSHAPFKLVLMDLTIPGGLGGEAAIKLLLKEFPDARAIVVSGYSDSPVMANFADYGFLAAIAKPYTISTVTEALRSLGAGGGGARN
jgi:PAS domain S-box-containing protein